MAALPPTPLEACLEDSPCGAQLASTIAFDQSFHNVVPIFDAHSNQIRLPDEKMVPKQSWVQQWNDPHHQEPIMHIMPACARVDWSKRIRRMELNIPYRLLLRQLQTETFTGIHIPLQSIVESVVRCKAKDCLGRNDAVGIERPHLVYVHSIVMQHTTLKGTAFPAMPWTFDLRSHEHATPRLQLHSALSKPVAPVKKSWVQVQNAHYEVLPDGQLTQPPHMLLYPNDPQPLTVPLYQARRTDIRTLEHYLMLLHHWPSYFKTLPQQPQQICVAQPPVQDLKIPAQNCLSYALFRRKPMVSDNHINRTHTLDNWPHLSWPRVDFEAHLDTISEEVFRDNHSLLGTSDQDPHLHVHVAPLRLAEWVAQAARAKANPRIDSDALAFQMQLRLTLELIVV